MAPGRPLGAPLREAATGGGARAQDPRDPDAAPTSEGRVPAALPGFGTAAALELGVVAPATRPAPGGDRFAPNFVPRDVRSSSGIFTPLDPPPPGSPGPGEELVRPREPRGSDSSSGRNPTPLRGEPPGRDLSALRVGAQF